MGRIVCSLFFFILANAVEVQIITGKITDKDKRAVVPFANIALKDNLDKIKFATSSDSLGNYKLKVPAGAYTIYVSSLSFTSFSKKITIHADSTINVYLTPDNKTLDEIVVVAEKTTIEQHIDKKVIIVGKDLLSAGGDATSILEQLAEIKIDPDGNVALRGSQNVTVLLNGKRSGLSVAELLKQIPASQIFKIEVITTPSLVRACCSYHSLSSSL